jgi:hypothetical protein
MSLESKLAKFYLQDFFNGKDKYQIPKEKWKELIDIREDKIKGIAYPHDSKEFDQELSRIYNEFTDALSSYPIKPNRSEDVTKTSQSINKSFTEFDEKIQSAEKTRLLLSEILAKKVDNSEFEMNRKLMNSATEAFKNPFRPKGKLPILSTH